MTDGRDAPTDKPVVLVTGAAGNIGTALTEKLRDRFEVVGLDTDTESDVIEIVEIDLTDDASVSAALGKVREMHGGKFASVLHLAAYFDFSGKEKPQYEAVNEKGTERLLKALQEFDVGQFVYASTMLVHRAGSPGELIDEETPIDPGWAYPKSKAKTEEVIRETAGEIPYVLLRFAGLYDEKTAVPTLSHQIARIYERDLKSHVYAGDMAAGQSFIHQDDLIDALERTIERRDDIDSGTAILVGETQAMGYEALQNRIGELVHGEDEWTTIVAPTALAKAGAWIETKAEPVVPDEFDQGEKPFIRAFMIELASDHYALDTSRARKLLGWEPRHHISDGLADIVASLKDDPGEWYRANGITEPTWLVAAEERDAGAEAIRERHETQYRRDHYRSLWTHWANMGIAVWLLTSPPLLGYGGTWMAVSDYLTGLVLLPLAFLSLSWNLPHSRYACALVGCWLLMAPLVTWTDNAAAYLNATVCGLLIVAFAIAFPPAPGVSPTAAQTGPSIPKGWEYNPSSWFQRIPVVALAVVGLIGSRYLTAYQLETVPGVWEPFFDGASGDGKNGTEEIITSSVSEAWPVPDAGIGAVTYGLEIIVGLIGSQQRWRTMPWLTLLFGMMIVPLGAISIFFIVIQPIVIGTYCTVCLILAAAMLVQIPYSVDEILATCQFLKRRRDAGQPLLRVFVFGDTDEGPEDRTGDDFEQSPRLILKDMLTGGLSVTWSLGLSMLIGVWLMLTPFVLGIEGGMASVNHMVGALVLTVTVTAVATVARAVRFLNVLLGVLLIFAPFFFDIGLISLVSSIVTGLALVALAIPRGPIETSYGSWDRLIF